MIDANQLNNEAYNLRNDYRGELVGAGLQATAQAELLREERVKNLLGIINTPWVAQRLDGRTQESIIETLRAVALVYNKELREDPTIKEALPKEHNVDDELNKMFK